MESNKNRIIRSSESSRRMKSQRTRDTKCELNIRKILHSNGFRYRVDIRPVSNLNRKADIVFPKLRVAIFVDGCFWHGCTHHRGPSKTNSEWWTNKISSNRQRDRDTDMRLESQGWIVIRVWEHEDPQLGASRIMAAVIHRRAG